VIQSLVENRTRRSEPNQNARRSPLESFDCELSPEVRSELEEADLPRAPSPPPPPACRPPLGAYNLPPKRSYTSVATWVLGLVVILLFFWVASRNNGPSASPTRSSSSSSSSSSEESRPVSTPFLAPQPVEVRRAIPVDVRRALPAVPRAELVSSAVLPGSNAMWQSVRMPDGTVLPVSYQGNLSSSAALPGRGRFIGEEWSSGTTSWVWMTPAGASFPSWVDP
jgi:hypothetical protein